MKEVFRDKKFNTEGQRIIDLCDQVVDRYLAMELRLTLRQLYYQLVANHGYANTEKNYKRLSTLVSDARLAGLLDWDAIEDRVRRPSKHPEWPNVASLVESALYSYRLPRWEGQETYVELWVEKDALAGVLSPLSEKFHVTLMVNRGYSSQSAMYESSKRFMRYPEKQLVLFYLGDHDPSGEDMVRDIRDRLAMFGVGVDVRKLALTMDQIKDYDPPPNPAKITDPRAAKYIERHGDQSWEVDALPPNVLQELITKAFKGVINRPMMDKIKMKEDADKDWLRDVVKEYEERES